MPKQTMTAVGATGRLRYRQDRGGSQLQLGRDLCGGLHDAAGTLIAVAAALGLLIWLMKYTLPSVWWLAPAAVFIVSLVVLLSFAEVASRNLRVTIQDGQLDVHERRPLGGNRRLSCRATDVLSVELGSTPAALRVFVCDGRVLEFLDGRRAEDLYEAMITLRQQLDLRPLADIRGEAVTTYGRQLACGGEETLPYAAGVPQLFRDPADDAVVIRLPLLEARSLVRLTSQSLAIEELKEIQHWPLDRLIDLRVTGDADSEWLAISTVGESDSNPQLDGQCQSWGL